MVFAYVIFGDDSQKVNLPSSSVSEVIALSDSACQDRDPGDRWMTNDFTSFNKGRIISDYSEKFDFATLFDLKYFHMHKLN